MASKKTAAQTIDKQIREAVLATSHNFLLIGQLLRDVREQELWAELGAESFEEYASVVCGLGLKRVGARIRLYEVYGKYALGDHVLLPVTKMRILVPVVNEQNVHAWMERAADMSCADLRTAVIEEREKLRKAGKLPRLRKSEQRHHIMGLTFTKDEEKEVRKAIDFAKGYFEDIKTNGTAVAAMMRVAQEVLAPKKGRKHAA